MSRRLMPLFLLLSCMLFQPVWMPAAPAKADRVQLMMDTGEAEQVLAILALRAKGAPVPDSQWSSLFATEPYQRLKKREAAIGEQFHEPSLAFTDDDFKKFVLSDDMLKKAPELSATLERWKQANLQACADRALAYLPDSATIHAKIYPVIKPRTNSFVWEASTNAAIFLYLDPAVGREKMENTVAHELHHIGLGSLGPVYDKKIESLSPNPRAAAGWMAAFGEGLAMLAAAGGPDADPQAASDAEQRALWAHDLAQFNTDLPAVDTFFADTIAGKFPNSDAIDEKASSFYGAQGPWYTLGYKMAIIVEKRFGRAALIDTMLDPRCLLLLYNRAAAEMNAASQQPPLPLPLWSAQVLEGVSAGPCLQTAPIH